MKKSIIITSAVILIGLGGYFSYYENTKPENIALAQINDIQKEMLSITNKCRSSIWTTLPNIQDRNMLDSLYGKASQKENACLKNELIILIKETFDRPEDQEKMLELVNNLEKNTLQFYQTGVNYNKYCKNRDHPEIYDCGSFAQYISAPTEWNRQLLKLYEFVLSRKYINV